MPAASFAAVTARESAAFYDYVTGGAKTQVTADIGITFI
jgi:hypothetical protein